MNNFNIIKKMNNIYVNNKEKYSEWKYKQFLKLKNNAFEKFLEFFSENKRYYFLDKDILYINLNNISDLMFDKIQLNLKKKDKINDDKIVMIIIFIKKSFEHRVFIETEYENTPILFLTV